MLRLSLKAATRAAMDAALQSPAYRILLLEHGIDPNRIPLHSTLSVLPVLTKSNTFQRFSLSQLTRPVNVKLIADVLTSSGRGGPGLGFRLTERKDHEMSWFDIDLGLQDAFDVDRNPTLLVNCLPMGVVFRSRAVAVANVSVREDMACSILRDVGPRFTQTILCTDPLFVKRLLDQGLDSRVDWKQLNTSVIMGEEMLVEAQREYIAARMGIDLENDAQRFIGSSFGIGELGLNLLFETRETIRLRRLIRSMPAVRQALVAGSDVTSLPSIFCYSPMRCHIEILNPDADGFGELCFTMCRSSAPIALPRYATGDLGRIISSDELKLASITAGIKPPWLPVLALKGRISDREAGLPSVEEIKEVLYADHAIADCLTGAFRIAHDENGQRYVLVQANGREALASSAHSQSLTSQLNKNREKLTRIEVVAIDEFPWRPSLDYERKFCYLPMA